ncbi:hypothetical protein N5P37_006360 [Trichoderma harzianum]|uniref:Extracellular membrane protein CFEM domain-containing protein n=1 Tax=Trichoderma harzianum CBS 226.95 TaxID=983964 RepID=A0A2T4A9K0_TRIHA|nr:hypothetical protein M431DRAFT_495727 [Trichoderma harzianum CBS 226.95]KAK0761410.1 hypothetical protein N5P37_006360 [Trichoderma harzianum]PTB53769.1 hypothetical protein M431DRAFT_495727 [Trichoderma harzianum CBS 226.95]
MQFSALLLTIPAAFVTASPITERQVASGCYAFEDPGCGINYAVCQCANGWFYQFNQDNANNGNYCNPPWGILATSESGLPGYSC